MCWQGGGFCSGKFPILVLHSSKHLVYGLSINLIFIILLSNVLDLCVPITFDDDICFVNLYLNLATIS